MTPHLFWALVSLVVLPTLYLLPSIIGWARGVCRLSSLVGFNLIAGFTGLGWLYALGWSITGKTRSAELSRLNRVALATAIYGEDRRQPPRLDQDARLHAAMGLDRIMVPTSRWPRSGR